MAVDEGSGGGGVGGTWSFAMTEPQYVPAKVSVWWDLENCHVPKGCEPHLIAKNISSALVSMNYCGPVSINAYGDTTKIAPSDQQALNSTGISLNHVPAGAKDASDKKILVDMLFWAVDNPAPGNYLLISGDRDFSNALHQLRMRRYNILLAQPTRPSIHLIAAAKNVWLWSSLVTGGPPLKNTELSHFINSITSTIPETGSTQINQSGYGLPNKTSNSQNLSSNPISTVPIPVPTHTFSNNGNYNHGYFENNPYRMPIRPLSHAHSMPSVSPRPNNTFTFTAGPLNYSPHTNNLIGTEHSDLNYRPHAPNGPNTVGFNNQLPSYGPQNGFTVPNVGGFNNQLPINGPQKGLTGPNITVSDSKSTVNKPKKVKQTTNEYFQGLREAVKLALHTLRNEKIMPTAENIAACIKYGDLKYQKTNPEKALKCAIKQELVVKNNLGVLEFYVGKYEKLWKCVNLISGNVEDYPECLWGEVENFLSSASGRDAILATKCRYEAAMIMKKECLKDLSLGKILQLIQMIIEHKKWIIVHESGWKPLDITFTDANLVLGVVASSDVQPVRAEDPV